MTRLATSFVLGYHGCDYSVARRAIEGEIEILQSDRDFDWLGPGAYFWESDPLRAFEWAQWKVEQGAYSRPAVVGAVIDLRNCLDLVARENLVLLKDAYDSFLRVQRKAGLTIPTNENAPGPPSADRVLRYLDCAVVRHLHELMDADAAAGDAIEPFDTVRGMFTEGGRLYRGSGIYKRTHVQVAVRNSQCVKGLFIPRPNPAA